MSSTSSQSSTPTQTPDVAESQKPGEPQPSYVKLAMRNMVRKGSKSLFHFSLTAIALLGFLIGVSYITR
ncbi:MAG: DUF3285 domain-containing protein [Lyngbya sp.]|nr:DUF3285 domain-containing protein [Lyngbya sp.]